MDFVPPLSVGQNPLALLLCSPAFNVYNGQYKYETGWIEYQATKAKLNNKKNAYSKIQLPVEFFYFLLRSLFISISRYHFYFRLS